jgi:hypothetical protein
MPDYRTNVLRRLRLTGVVDQHIDASKLGTSLLDQRIDLIFAVVNSACGCLSMGFAMARAT